MPMNGIQLGAEPPGGPDPGHVGDHRCHQRQPEHRHDPADLVMQEMDRTGGGRHGQDPDPAAQAQGHGTHAHPGPGHDDGRQRLGRRRGREEEIDGQGHGSEEPPHHPDRVDPRGPSPGQVQDQDQPGDRGDRAGHGQPPRPLAVPQPEPADHQHGAEVLQQQGHADTPGHPEVEQLAASHTGQAVGGHPRRGPAQRRRAAAHLDEGGNGEHHRSQGDPGEYRRGRAPSGTDERGGEGPGRPESRRGQDAEGQPGAPLPDPARPAGTVSTTRTTRARLSACAATSGMGHDSGLGGSHCGTPGHGPGSGRRQGRGGDGAAHRGCVSSKPPLH